jgi:hypothetical protein
LLTTRRLLMTVIPFHGSTRQLGLDSPHRSLPILLPVRRVNAKSTSKVPDEP